MTGTAARKMLLVNADDLGWSASVNRGIVDAHRRGLVTSASILAAGRSVEHAMESVRDLPELSLGVHLNFYRGWPVQPPAKVGSLLGEGDMFPGDWRTIVKRLATGRIVMGELESEFRAAIERVIGFGITPAHLDSEKHLHMWPSVFDLTCSLAAEYGIPRVRVVREPRTLRGIPLGLSALGVRNAREAARCGLTSSQETIGVTEAPVDLPALDRLLASARAHTVEFVCHPGLVDDEFRALQETVPNRLVCSREDELATLTHETARARVASSGYELCSRFGS